MVGVRAIERGHGVYDAEHRGDDAEAGQRVCHFLYGVRGLMRFLVMRFQLVFEQAFELVRIHVAAHDETQAVRDELDHVTVFENPGVLLEERALVGAFEVCLDGHDAFFPDLHQDVVDELQECDVVLTPVARALGQRERALECAFDNLLGVAGEERAHGGAHNDDDLAGVPQRKNVTAFHGEAADNAAEHEDGTDDLEHGRTTRSWCGWLTAAAAHPYQPQLH
jgi:hypothetical protein